MALFTVLCFWLQKKVISKLITCIFMQDWEQMRANLHFKLVC